MARPDDQARSQPGETAYVAVDSADMVPVAKDPLPTFELRIRDGELEIRTG